ncbi:MAG: sugar phosphate isomerase/epimerase [Candidatus Fermentibacteraceae bacterium]|nr:sugar phosphate isomerase/epimerase [Candidatus Fermentibacteraceae bacterium]MBN2607747.1 sugar phosphate isomerase/epimerase [Candidatus Fermentibacteraceae bacterium]
MNRLSMNVLEEDLQDAAAFCREQDLGIEVTAFAFPEKLDGDVDSLVDSHRAAVEGIHPLSFHGPFFDLIATSPDPRIVDVARLRHEKAIAAAAALGAGYYIAHTNYTPVIRNPRYRDGWTGRMLDFWMPLADRAAGSGMVICLENLWEPVPDTLQQLLEKADHDSLRMTLDNGHVLVFSRLSTTEWVERLGRFIVHCHLHDNMGEMDEHLPVGEGIEDWQKLIRALKRHAPDALLVAESDGLADNMISIERLKELMKNERDGQR